MFPKNMAEIHEGLSKRLCVQSVSELEILVEPHENEVLTMPFSKQVQATLIRGADLISPPVLLVSSSKIHGILDLIRTKVLNWALDLESQGVIGENLSFSEKEQKAASNITINVETMTNSQIQADTIGSTQNLISNQFDINKLLKVLSSLEHSLDKISINTEMQHEIMCDIQTIKIQAESQKPKISIIKESLRSIRTILEGAAGSIVAQKLLNSLASFT